VKICGEEFSEPIEIETEEDGSFPLESVTAHFPGTTTLKYKAPSSTAWRSVKIKDGVMSPPSEGWGDVTKYICVNPTKAEKRKAEVSTDQPASKGARGGADEDWGDDSNSRDRNAPTDLILLGLDPTTAEATIREYFSDLGGELNMVQLKKSKDDKVGYAFVKFNDKEAERKLKREKHLIEGRECQLKVPDSQQGERAERKVYVSYHNSEITADDLREHFEKYGDVDDVFIPQPWRHFCFVTFAERGLAQSLIGKEHTMKGVSLLIKSNAQMDKKKKADAEARDREQAQSNPWENGPYGHMNPMMGGYGMGPMGMGGMGMGPMGIPAGMDSMGMRGMGGMGNMSGRVGGDRNGGMGNGGRGFNGRGGGSSSDGKKDSPGGNMWPGSGGYGYGGSRGYGGGYGNIGGPLD